jgi:polyribonucleotide 5'-hydroxyl-kinase
MHIYVNI